MESHCKHSEINKFSIEIFIVIFIFLSIKDLFLTLILPFFFFLVVKNSLPDITCTTFTSLTWITALHNKKEGSVMFS